MKIEFSKIKEENLEMIRNWRNSPEVSDYMYTNDFITADQQKEWFSQIKDNPTKKYWLIKVDDKYVGVLNLSDIDERNKRCYWGCYLAEPSIRGKGVGRLIELNIIKHVFEDLGLNKLCGEVLSANEIVIKIHEKYGFRIEGHFREHIFKDGKFHDITCIAITRKEWSKIKRDFDIIEFEG